jgi:hypothetical protein
MIPVVFLGRIFVSASWKVEAKPSLDLERLTDLLGAVWVPLSTQVHACV